MSDVSLRMTLQDDVSGKIDQLSSKVRTASSQLKTFGRDIDNAFRTRGAESFASTLGSSMDTAASSAAALGDALDNALNSMDYSAASALEGSLESAQTAALGLADSTTTAGNGLADLTSRSAAVNELGSGAENASKSMEQLGGAASDAAEELGDIGDGEGFGQVASEADNAGRAMDNASSRAENFGNTMKKVIAVLGLAKLASEIKEFTASTVELGKGFTSQMSEVGAISGATGQELQALEDTAREYGSTTIFSASQAAEALKYMSLAGWDANQSSSALGGVLNLAAASGMELGEASDMVTDYLTAFGMEAQQSTYFADMLSYAQANSNTTARQLGEAYLNSAAQMHAAGQDVETTTALLEAMANQGTKGARAGTQLTAMARDITQHMEDGKIMIGDTAIAVQDAEGNFRDFTAILGDVEDAVAGLGTAERAAALGEVFTADSTKGINQILTEGVDNIAAYEQALRSSAGAAEEAADIMNDNLTGDLANLNSATEEMKLKIFENLEQPLRQLTQYGTKEVIPALSEWLPDAFGTAAEGISKVGQALKPLFEMIINNPEAVGTGLASIGAGLTTLAVGSKAAKIGSKITELGGLGAALTKFAGPLLANPWVAGAAAFAAGVTAIGLALKEYNDIQVEETLAEKFGDVSLTDFQIDDLASQILDAQWKVNIESSLDSFSKAEDLAKQARDALASNDAIEWKAKIGLQLSEEDTATYAQNIQTFIDSSLESLQQQTLAVSLALSFTDFTLDDGSSLGSRIQEWAAEDMLKMEGLSNQLTNVVQKALEDGILDVNEQAAINLLQEKINSIEAGWKKAEADAQMKMLEHEYGKLSGKDLTEDSFTELVGKLQEQRETAVESLNESTTAALQSLEGLHESGRLTDAEYQRLVEGNGTSEGEIWQAARNERAEMLLRSMDLETNTLSDAFGDRLSKNQEGIQQKMQGSLSSANSALARGDAENLQIALGNGMNQATYSGIFSGAEQQSLGKMWETMKPDADALTSLVDEYRQTGQQIPQAVMDSFNQAMELGAAAGDQSAAAQILANQIVGDDANAALEKAILDGTANVPADLKAAVERATMETTTDPVNLGTLSAEMEDVEVDQEKVDQILGDAVDETQKEAQAAADGAASDPVEVEQTVDTTVVPGETDNSALGEAVQNDVASEAGTVEVEQSANVNLTKASDNIDAVYDQVGSEIDSKFSADYNTTARLHVSITVDYSIANPSKTVTFGGAGSGSGTITAHALGGYFDQPHLGIVAEDGGEYIIPMNDSSRSLEMWKDAGQMLGIDMSGFNGQGSALGVFQRLQGASGAGDAGFTAPSQSAAPAGSQDRNININIGGNGSIRVSGGGVNKESVVEMMMENLRDVFMQIVEQEIVEEGEGAYVY